MRNWRFSLPSFPCFLAKSSWCPIVKSLNLTVWTLPLMSVLCFPSEGAGTVWCHQWWREQLDTWILFESEHCSTEQRTKEDSVWWTEEIRHVPSLELGIYQILTSYLHITIAANKYYENYSSLTHVTDYVFFIFSIRLCSLKKFSAVRFATKIWLLLPSSGKYKSNFSWYF